MTGVQTCALPICGGLEGGAGSGVSEELAVLQSNGGYADVSRSGSVLERVGIADADEALSVWLRSPSYRAYIP